MYQKKTSFIADIFRKISIRKLDNLICTHTHTHTHIHTHIYMCVCVCVCVCVCKVSDRSRWGPKGSLFNSHSTKM